MAVYNEEFVKRNVKPVAVSCDELKDHTSWVNVSIFLIPNYFYVSSEKCQEKVTLLKLRVSCNLYY